jgi:hypothetical protein
METLLLFLKIVTWVVAIFSTVWGLFILYLAIDYGTEEDPSLSRLADRLSGVHKTFSPWRYIIVGLLCWIWIIAGWLT